MEKVSGGVGKTAGNKLALIGGMGCGKSTLANRIAKAIGGTVFDTDEEFTRRYGDISEFFAVRGEEEFRKIETELLIQASCSSCDIIACGGGSVLSRRGMAALRKTADILYISVPTEVLLARVSDGDRPLKNKLAKIMAERAPLYDMYADHTVDGGGSVESTLAAIMSAIKTSRGNRYDIVLCDADDTVLDFESAMRYSIVETAHAMGVKADDNRVIEEYSKISPRVWRMLECGEIDRNTLFTLRFEMLAKALNENLSAESFNAEYMRIFKTTRFVIDGATAFLDELRRRGISVYIITNSSMPVAVERLKALERHIDGAYVSEEVGFDKPDVRFFEIVHKRIGEPDKSRVIVFGDGVNSDIRGGAAFGIDTCLFDPSGKKRTDDALYTTKSYRGFLDIV